MTDQAVLPRIPNSSVPVVDKDGNINQAWYLFFLALGKLSGLATPGLIDGGTDGNRLKNFVGAVPLSGVAWTVIPVMHKDGAGIYTLRVYNPNTGDLYDVEDFAGNAIFVIV